MPRRHGPFELLEDHFSGVGTCRRTPKAASGVGRGLRRRRAYSVGSSIASRRRRITRTRNRPSTSKLAPTRSTCRLFAPVNGSPTPPPLSPAGAGDGDADGSSAAPPPPPVSGSGTTSVVAVELLSV